VQKQPPLFNQPETPVVCHAIHKLIGEPGDESEIRIMFCNLKEQGQEKENRNVAK